MTLRIHTLEEKVQEVEALILKYRPSRRDQDDTPEFRRYNILKSIASDLRGRAATAPSAGLALLQPAVNAAARSKTSLGYDYNKLRIVGQEVMGRWPIIRQALELFGALLESGDSPLEAAFRAGFEHAVAGGEEAAKFCGIPRGRMPLVMYFDNEEDRREMIDAVCMAKPMVTIAIPERAP